MEGKGLGVLGSALRAQSEIGSISALLGRRVFGAAETC